METGNDSNADMDLLNCGVDPEPEVMTGSNQTTSQEAQNFEHFLFRDNWSRPDPIGTNQTQSQLDLFQEMHMTH